MKTLSKLEALTKLENQILEWTETNLISDYGMKGIFGNDNERNCPEDHDE